MALLLVDTFLSLSKIDLSTQLIIESAESHMIEIDSRNELKQIVITFN